MTSKAQRDLVELSDLIPEAIRQIIERAKWMRQCNIPLWTTGVRHVGLIFSEPSTRTSLSFVAAAHRLGAEVLELRAEASSLCKGETLLDTAWTLESLGATALVVRDADPDTAPLLAQRCRAGVINGGGGTRSHPSQGLLDALTLIDEFGDLEGKVIGIVGDLLHSRVARSDLVVLRALGAKVVLVAPDRWQDTTLAGAGVELETDLEAVLPHLDAIQLLRIQHERFDPLEGVDPQQYLQQYQLDQRRLEMTKRSLVVLHPGPMNRGVEITSEVADGTRSRIRQQVANGVPMRMALLERAFGEGQG
ncbi:MAG: aspartate carbamoyltransferase catalytic subunit [Planctomycetota bacterium]|nr:aspartate carbamoyltransferase catalytic subunit [Planctomycetota bacterium]